MRKNRGKWLSWNPQILSTDGKSNVAKILKVVDDRVENILGQGENHGYQHFLLFPQCFQKVFFSLRVIKTRLLCCIELSMIEWKNIVGNGENVGHQHFIRFPRCFRKCFPCLRVIKTRYCVVKS